MQPLTLPQFYHNLTNKPDGVSRMRGNAWKSFLKRVTFKVEYKDSIVWFHYQLQLSRTSPDGLTTCNCCIRGCMEIKCLSNVELAASIQFYLDRTNSHQRTKTFAFSCQAMNFIWRKPLFTIHKYNLKFLWLSQTVTLKDMAVVCVFPDQEFWEVCLPALVAKYYSNRYSNWKTDINICYYFDRDLKLCINFSNVRFYTWNGF